MSLDLYDSTVAVFIRHLKNLSAVLKKVEKVINLIDPGASLTCQAEQWCDDNGQPHSALLEARLAPDMFPLTSQIRLCVRWARNGVLLNEGYYFQSTDGRPDIKHSFAELQAMVQDTLQFLEGVKREDIAGAENKPVDVWSSGKEGEGHNVKLSAGHKLLHQVVFPNFWFHDCAAYAICRSKTVPVGKLDFLMGGGPLDP